MSKNAEKLVHFKTKTEKTLISLNDIIYIHGHEKELSVYLTNTTKFEATERIKYFYERLNDPRFLLVHNEYIINMDLVRAEKKDSFLMADNTVIPIRNYGRNDLINSFYKYKRENYKKTRNSHI